jgi:hypothetical protein
MDKPLIKLLKLFLQISPYSREMLYWMPDTHTSRKVVSISTPATEFSECALFSDGTYVALDGCDLPDFKLVKEMPLPEDM